jgi:glycosyltransferase involved in cell wall biosynthesis
VVREREVASFCRISAAIPGGGGTTPWNSDILRLQRSTKIFDDICQGRIAVVIDNDDFKFAGRQRLSGQSVQTCPKTARVIMRRYDDGEKKFGLTHPTPMWRIWVYDPAHFTPYYNAGLCAQFAFMGVPCTLVTSPPAFEAVPAAGYKVSYLFFRMMRGSAGAFLRNRPPLRRALKALSYPLGVWRTCRTLKSEPAGVFHIHFSVIPFLDGLLAAVLRERAWRVVYTLQEPHPDGLLNRWQYRRLMKNCDIIVMHDVQLAEQLSRMFPELSPKIASLTHGMDLPTLPSAKDRAEARAGLGVLPGETLLLFFGMIKPYKGLEDVLDAMPSILTRMPKVRLCIAGEPLMDMRTVMERIRRLPPDTVILHPVFVPQAQIGQYFAAADLVLACYRQVAASSVVLQAQSYASPVLVTRVGALAAAVEDGNCGFLAEEDLATSIIEALRDPDHLREMGRRGRERIERLHAWEHVARETLRLYGIIRKEADAALSR